MTSLFTLFRHKHCTLPIALEIGKISNYLLHFSFLNTENAKNAKDGISKTIIYKLFYRSMLPFKISHYATGYNTKDDSLRRMKEVRLIIFGAKKDKNLGYSYTSDQNTRIHRA